MKDIINIYYSKKEQEILNNYKCLINKDSFEEFKENFGKFRENNNIVWIWSGSSHRKGEMLELFNEAYEGAKINDNCYKFGENEILLVDNNKNLSVSDSNLDGKEIIYTKY